MNSHLKHAATATTATLLALALAGCGNGSSNDSGNANGDVPIAYTQRSTSLSANPTNGAPFAAGGDLMVRDKSSPSATETNLTARYTEGKGDVSDPEVSYDGKKIVFTMKCPTTNTATFGADKACTGRWNIWEYDMTVGGLTGGTFRRLTNSIDDDDVDPAYLPAGGGFVFTSNRQTTSKHLQKLAINAPADYFALDEYERERVMNLHTMDVDGNHITQISVNQSHDRNPVVLTTGAEAGRIMFSRWEHVGPRNRFAVFTVNPDGTNMFVRYGAQSPGNSFLHPREMDPNGPNKGYIASDLMPLSRTHEGGALMFIDAENYSEDGAPANKSLPSSGGQKSVTFNALNSERGLSKFGRITTPYPLWDGTNRVLVAYRPCEVTKNGNVVLCATLQPEELASVSMDMSTVTDAVAAANPIKDNAPPRYGISMFDPAKQTLLTVATPPAGYMYTDPVALQSRTPPPVKQAAVTDTTDSALAAAGLGTISVKSVYDTDGLGRMGEGMLTAADRLAGCTLPATDATTGQPNPLIALTDPPADPSETRVKVPDIAKMRDPAEPAYGCAPARFIRAIRAVAPPSNSMGVRSAIGQTDFEQQQILGYAPIEPDGSFRIQVPANTPIGLAVVDAKGRGIQTHLNWIQVRPGERRTCDGCHSPRRGGALNSGALVNQPLPTSIATAMRTGPTGHSSGETMAETRTRVDATLLTLSPNMSSTDVWPADMAKAKPTIDIRYTGNKKADGSADVANDLATEVPTNGLINYPTHIQPLWERARAGGTCISCHSDATKLDLRGTKGGTGRLISYEELLVGDPVIDPATNRPQFRVEDGVPIVVRGPALVETMAGGAVGMARSSRLTEIMFGETLKAPAEALVAHPNPAMGPDHSVMLNKAEKRLIVEWMDLGGQYFNDPYAGGVMPTMLSETTFASAIQPILASTCSASCHQAIGATAGADFRQNRFVLTGSAEGDFGVTLSMISDTCAPTSSYLLTRPSTIPHPAAAAAQATAVLPAGGASYTTIANWISTGCTP